MSTKKILFWQAYLDGELSVSEMSEFETSLTPEERERLAAEMQFEGALADRLGQDAACPEDVWKRTKALLSSQRVDSRRVYRPWFLGAVSLAAAATVAFMVSVFTPIPSLSSPALVLAAETVEDLAATSESEAGRESVQAYLDSYDIDLHISSLDSLAMASKHHKIELLGTRTEYAAGEPIVEMLFSCCERPVKVIMAAHGSAAAREIGDAAGGDSQVGATRSIHGYLAAVVGDHRSYGLLEIFGDD